MNNTKIPLCPNCGSVLYLHTTAIGQIIHDKDWECFNEYCDRLLVDDNEAIYVDGEEHYQKMKDDLEELFERINKNRD